MNDSSSFSLSLFPYVLAEDAIQSSMDSFKARSSSLIQESAQDKKDPYKNYLLGMLDNKLKSAESRMKNMKVCSSLHIFIIRFFPSCFLLPYLPVYPYHCCII